MIDPGRIAAWLPLTRWFAGKGGDAAHVSIRDMAPIPGTKASLALLEVATAAASDIYFAPLADDADATLMPGVAPGLLDAILAGTTLAGPAGVFRGHPSRAGARAPTGSVARISALGGDASNTSLLVEQAGLSRTVKLLRRCRPGIHPEVEIGEFLTNHARWEGTPAFLGWLEYATGADESIAVATAHEFAAGRVTAWERLVPLVATGGLAGPPRAEILDIAGALGRTTAAMHRALASRPGIAAFAPEAATADDNRAEADRMLDHATGVLSLACSRLPFLPPPLAATVERMLAGREGLVAPFHRLADVAPWGALIRIHGDYHLGQVLLRRTGTEALVIDFEGEPGRSLADRRRKTTAVKDVAGMCRSFDYLLRHAARVGCGAYDRAHLRLLEGSYLDGYRAVADGQDWWPADAAVADALLAVYKLDKALYELAYELTNRPDWVEVPLAALLA